jgi:hypothetical protein
MFIGALLSAGVLIAILTGTGRSDPAYGPQQAVAATPALDGGLITHLSGADGQVQTLTVLDPHSRWIGVYHIAGSGEITLKSARNFSWDLQLIEFNSGKPLPQEIRSGLPPR